MTDGAPLPPGAAGPGEIGRYVGAGGRALRYRVVRARPERRRLVYLHGIESHGTWFLPAAFDLAARGVTTWLLDRRGSGLNRDAAPGDARSADELLADVSRFRAGLGGAPVVLAGLSWGGKLALAAALAEPDGVRAVVLVTPGLVPAVDLSPLQKLRLLASAPFGGRASIEVPIEPGMFTTVSPWHEFIRDDPWRQPAVTARLLLAGRALDARVRRGLPRLRAPVLLLLARGDRIVDNARTRDLLGAAPDGLLTVKVYEDATHSIQLEQRERMVADVTAFLEERAGP